MENKSNTIKLPSPADRILPGFVSKISNIQPNFIDGVYLTGSIPMNDFYSNKSDIDFLVFCKELPNKKIASLLKHIHKEIEKEFHKPDLSGCYLASDSIQTDHPENIKVLSYHESSMCYETFQMAPISLSELKSNAFTVLGMKAETLPVIIKPIVLNNFLYENINSYWRKWIKQHSSFFNRKIILLIFPRFTEWVILGVARQLCTLQTGKIVSKTEAGNYCLAHIPAEFHPIIQEAIKIRKDNRTYPFVKSYAIKPSFKRLSQTIECANYIIALFNKIYHERHKQDGKPY